MALAFARHGYAVAVNYKSNAEEAASTVQSIESNGGTGRVVQADVRFSKEVEKMIEQISGAWGRLDVLVNNAGTVRNTLISKMTDQDWKDVMEINLDGAFFCTRAALPLMREQKNGTILNIASYLALRPARGGANYAVSKAGLIALTQSTAIEEGSFNVRANAILPGFHVTDMNRDVWGRFEEKIRDQHMLKNLPSKEEMAEFVVAVAGLTSVTGQIFPFESRPL